MGVSGPENLGVVRELADALGGASWRDKGRRRRRLASQAAADRSVRQGGGARAVRGRRPPRALQSHRGYPEGGHGRSHQQQRESAHLQGRGLRHPGRLRRGLASLIGAMERRGLTAGPQTPSTKSRLSHNPSKALSLSEGLTGVTPSQSPPARERFLSFPMPPVYTPLREGRMGAGKAIVILRLRCVPSQNLRAALLVLNRAALLRWLRAGLAPVGRDEVVLLVVAVGNGLGVHPQPPVGDGGVDAPEVVVK